MYKYKFVTGDLHGKYDRFLDFFPSDATQDNCLVFICGDFGMIFNSYGNQESEDNKYKLDVMSDFAATFIVIPGNHENYDFVESNYPIDNWNGARVRYLRRNIIWVERGQILTIDDETYFCYGGANSIDKEHRIPSISWWAREEGNAIEQNEGIDNLLALDNKVDYIITHEVPIDINRILYNNWIGYSFSTTAKYLQYIYDIVDYKKWYAGHHHIQAVLRNNVRILYYDIKKIGE